MQRYLMNFSTKDLPVQKTDCLVVGSGVAGLITAWYAAEKGQQVLLMVKDTLHDSNTNQAQGGIASVFGKDDTFALHVTDTITAGAGLCDEEIVRLVVEEGHDAVEKLMELGAIFDRDEQGKIALGREGCHSRSRVLHAKGDATGAEVVRCLLAVVESHPNIVIMEHHYLVDLLVQQGTCYGGLVWGEQNKELLLIRAGALVLATGGAGRLFVHTTNPDGATGSGISIAYRAGAVLMDMEFVQFHPTALAFTGGDNFLISEAVRGAGGILRNARGERFMPKYHELAELAPRDIVARAIFQEMKQDGADHIYLDARAIDQLTVKFPMITATCETYGINIQSDLIPVAPAAHYMMGGIQVDQNGESNIHQLFACGEVACTGLHGANRLASNSLLEGLVFGRRIAELIALRHVAIHESIEWQCTSLQKKSYRCAITAMQKVMSRHLGLIRDPSGLEFANEFFADIHNDLDGTSASSQQELEYRNMLLAAQRIAQTAAMRQESRGGHYRSDYSRPLAAWQQHILEKSR
jgi:L-aspartate oxidase